MDVDLDKLIKRANSPNVKNHGIRRLNPANVPFNGIPSIPVCMVYVYGMNNIQLLKLYTAVKQLYSGIKGVLI